MVILNKENFDLSLKSEQKVVDDIHTKRFIVFLYLFFQLFLSSIIVLVTVYIFYPQITTSKLESLDSVTLLSFIALPTMIGTALSSWIFLLIVLNRGKEVANDFSMRFQKKKLLTILIFFVIYFVLNIVVNIVVYLLHDVVFNITGEVGSNQNQDSLETTIKNAPLVALIAIVILGPLMEEIAFRYAIIGSFKNRNVGIIVSIVVFASMHLLASIGSGSVANDLWTLPSYLLMGGILALIYVRTDNLMYSYLFHMINNLLAFIIIFI